MTQARPTALLPRRPAALRCARWPAALGARALAALSVALACAAVLGPPRPAQAARLQLRVRTALSMTWAWRGGALQVSGRLVDSMGRAVADAAIAVAATVEGAERVTAAAQSDGDGQWSCRLALPEAALGAALHVEAQYAGDASRGEAHSEATFDLAKPQTQLQLAGDQRRWSTAGPPWSVQLQVRTLEPDGQPGPPLVGAEVELRKDGQAWLQLRSDARGQVTAQQPLPALGGLGPHRLSARLAEAASHNASELHWTVEVFSSLDISLQAEPGRDGDGPCAADDWCLQGRVTLAGAGQPVQDAAVTLFSAQRQIGALVSDADGRFAAVLRGEALRRLLRQERVEVVAQASVGQPWVEAGWSEVLTLPLAPAPRWGEWAGGTALLLLGVAAALRQGLRRKRQADQLRKAEAEQAGLPAESFVAGVGQDSDCRVLSGRVYHGETGRPCAARLWLSAAGQPTQQWPCEEGTFFIEGLQDGAYVLRVEVAEHDPMSLAVTVPHSGAYQGCELRPASCRALVRGSLGGALRRVTGAGVDWGRETPRLVEPRWAQHSRRGRVEIRDAIKSSERALYGPHTPPELVDEVRHAIARVDEVQK